MSCPGTWPSLFKVQCACPMPYKPTRERGTCATRSSKSPNSRRGRLSANCHNNNARKRVPGGLFRSECPLRRARGQQPFKSAKHGQRLYEPHPSATAPRANLEAPAPASIHNAGLVSPACHAGELGADGGGGQNGWQREPYPSLRKRSKLGAAETALLARLATNSNIKLSHSVGALSRYQQTSRVFLHRSMDTSVLLQ